MNNKSILLCSTFVFALTAKLAGVSTLHEKPVSQQKPRLITAVVQEPKTQFAVQPAILSAKLNTRNLTPMDYEP